LRSSSTSAIDAAILTFRAPVRRSLRIAASFRVLNCRDGTPILRRVFADMSASIRVGTAGWSIPRNVRDNFPGEGSHLALYAGQLSAAEINSSFHRPHRRQIYERWAASVGPDFRFAVKMPKVITHTRRLVEVDEPLLHFADEISGLGEKLGPILIQLPPSLAFDAQVAQAFASLLRTEIPAQAVIEPRHPSWFAEDADNLLVANRIARVAADPPRVPAAAVPGGWRGLAYFRLHGTPSIYRSDYPPDRIATHVAEAVAARARGHPAWIIYDNTAASAATGNALSFARLLEEYRGI